MAALHAGGDGTPPLPKCASRTDSTCAVTGGPCSVAARFCNGFPHLGRIEPKNSSIGGLRSSIQYSSSSLFNTLSAPLFNSATRLYSIHYQHLYSIQRIISILFSDSPLLNRKQEGTLGLYSHSRTSHGSKTVIRRFSLIRQNNLVL